VKLVVAGVTDVGRLRDGNEDSFVVDERLTLFAVADGMGGHRGGEVASATAIEALRAAVASGRSIDDAVKAANVAVLEKASNDAELTGMGTTMTATTPVGGGALLIAHVGDSRAYLLRDGAIKRLTEDHSLVEELVREGRLTEEQAESHPQRAIITRALGADEDVTVDLYTVDVSAGDRVILCSDGLTTMLRDREIEGIARQEPDPRIAANRLIEAANEAGGDDNITVIVLDVTEVDDTPTPDPSALAEKTALLTRTQSVATEPEAVSPPPADTPRARRGNVRSIALVVVPLLFILAVAAGAIAYYDHNSWYFAAEGGEVVLFRGRPHPVIWSATRDSNTGIAIGHLSELGLEAVDHKMSFDSRPAALAFLRSATSTTTTLPTTTTTRPRARPRTTPTTRAKTATTPKPTVAGP
jgi:PPM family protein phosphatase